MAEPRVLQLLGPSTGGIRRVVASLSSSLGERGWQVRTAGPAGVLDGLRTLDAVVPVAISKLPAGRTALRRALDGVDVVHAHGLTAGWLAATMRSRPPLVVSVHNLVLDEVAGRTAPLLRRMEALLPAVADRTIALSPEVARRFAGSRGAARIRVIPPAAPVGEPARAAAVVRAELGIATGERLVVAGASRLTGQKDLPTLLRAMAAVDDAVLAVFGAGVEEGPLRELAAELGSRVVFGGQRSSVVDELAAADVVAFSSRWESGPLMLLEAMALGRPVVSTPVGFAADLVVHGITGLLVPVGQPGAMATAISELLDDPVLAETIGGAGRMRLLDHHGPDAMALATEAVYREVLA